MRVFSAVILTLICVTLSAQDEIFMVESFPSDNPRLNITRNTIYRLFLRDGNRVASQLSDVGLKLSPFYFRNAAYFLSFRQGAWRIAKTAISDDIGKEEVIVNDMPHMHQPRIVFDGAERIYVSGSEGIHVYDLNGRSLEVIHDFSPFEFVANGAALLGVNKDSRSLRLLDLKTKVVKDVDIRPITSIDAPLLCAGRDGVLIGFPGDTPGALQYKVINLVDPSVRADPTPQTVFCDYRFSDGVTSFARMKALQSSLFGNGNKHP